MSADPYTARVRELFANPCHAGFVDGGVEAYVDDQGVCVRFSMACFGGTIREMRFEAWGCPHVLAACEAVCADFEGRASDELGRPAVTELMQTLGIPEEKTGRILVIEDAMRLLRAAAREDSTPDH